MTYTKYPRTWHLPDSPNRGADGDHAYADYSTFEGREVVVTEKLDGENTTIYADGYTHARSISSGYHPTRTWVRALAGRVAHALPEGWRICGENTYGRHSIAYDALPSYFQLFAVYDDEDMCLWWDDTKEWAARLGVDLGAGALPRPVHHDRARCWTGRPRSAPSARASWSAGRTRSTRRAPAGRRQARPPDHVKTDQHWMHGEVPANGLARGA